jgi:hypothetical protein
VSIARMIRVNHPGDQGETERPPDQHHGTKANLS